MIENGAIREDGKRWDGTTWRKPGINHHMNEDGLIYYKRKYRSLEGYLQQGGKIDRLIFHTIKPHDISILAKALYDREKEGYIYVITNPAWPEWVKIGMAIDAEDRLNGYQTSSPMRDYQLVHAIATPDRAKAERVAHKAAAMCGERQGEWFKIANEEAVTILQHIKETEDEQKRESTD